MSHFRRRKHLSALELVATTLCKNCAKWLFAIKNNIFFPEEASDWLPVQNIMWYGQVF